MSTLTVYTSTPLSTPLAVAFYNLACQGLTVELKPLSELPTGPRSTPRRSDLYAQLEAVCLELASIGDQLTAHEAGTQRLGAGQENGLRARRDDLTSRMRGLQASLRAQKGGPANG